eukprot:3555600-Prymnesium_polylepis.1
MHPGPSGAKLQRLVAQLESLGADPERDGVFLDYSSRAVSGLKLQKPYCAHDLTRVIVLPHDRQCPKS